MSLNPLFLKVQQSAKPSLALDWGLIGSCIAFVALLASTIIGIVQIRANRPLKKDIKYLITSQSPLITVQDEFQSRLKILFDEREIENPTAISLYVYNSGSSSIKPEDFERPIFFSFGQNSKILSAEITKTTPENIRAKLSKVQNGIQLEPLLLNSNDTISMLFVISSPELFSPDDIVIDARIADIKPAKLENLQDILAKKAQIREIVFSSIAIITFSLLGSIISVRILQDFYDIKGMIGEVYSIFYKLFK